MNDKKMDTLLRAQNVNHSIQLKKQAIKRLKVQLAKEEVKPTFKDCQNGEVTDCCFSEKSRTSLAERAAELLEKEVKELEAQYKKL